MAKMIPPGSSLSAQVNQMLSAQQQLMQQWINQASVSAPTVFDDPRPPPLPLEAQIDPSQPDTLGWRAWVFIPAGSVGTLPGGDGLTYHVSGPILISPHMHTPWEAPELHVRQPWDEEEIVRGRAGIHARRMPHDWRRAAWPSWGMREGPTGGETMMGPLVTGVVERFGRYVMGKTGWRAEWVMIRALMAPSTDIGLALEQKFPDVPVYYSDKEKGHGHW